MKQVMGTRTIRIQVSMAVLIACFTLPWLFSDIRVRYPRLAVDDTVSVAAGEEAPYQRIDWDYDERQNEFLVKFRLHPALAHDKRAYTASLSVRTSKGSWPLENIRIDLEKTEFGRNTTVKAKLPTQLRQVGLADSRLYLTILRRPNESGGTPDPLLRFNGRLNAKQLSVEDIVHPHIGQDEQDTDTARPSETRQQTKTAPDVTTPAAQDQETMSGETSAPDAADQSPPDEVAPDR